MVLERGRRAWPWPATRTRPPNVSEYANPIGPVWRCP